MDLLEELENLGITISEVDRKTTGTRFVPSLRKELHRQDFATLRRRAQLKKQQGNLKSKPKTSSLHSAAARIKQRAMANRPDMKKRVMQKRAMKRHAKTIRRGKRPRPTFGQRIKKGFRKIGKRIAKAFKREDIDFMLLNGAFFDEDGDLFVHEDLLTAAGFPATMGESVDVFQST